ncbi:hypothetical protein [Micromonospora chalcea]|uniref:hypothetical protein n=1 Tax=Micromonospora chalcea TaxID=1874 RepID=UPI003D726CAA
METQATDIEIIADYRPILRSDDVARVRVVCKSGIGHMLIDAAAGMSTPVDVSECEVDVYVDGAERPRRIVLDPRRLTVVEHKPLGTAGHCC